MRNSKIFLTVLAVALLGASSPTPGWDRMKSLVGAWKGTAAGHTVSVTYALVSNGTALMETLDGGHDATMSTRGCGERGQRGLQYRRGGACPARAAQGPPLRPRFHRRLDQYPAARYTSLPSSSVESTFASWICEAGISKRFRSSTMRSAALPTSMEPVSFSLKSRYAPPIV